MRGLELLASSSPRGPRRRAATSRRRGRVLRAGGDQPVGGGAGYSQFHDVSVSCSGAPTVGALARERDRDAEEHAVVARVDHPVVVRVGEELDDVERAAVSREHGLPVCPGRSSVDLARAADGGAERDRLELRRRVRGEGGADALDGALDRHVHEPATVGETAGLVRLRSRSGRAESVGADGHLEDAQVPLDRLPADERDAVRGRSTRPAARAEGSSRQRRSPPSGRLRTQSCPEARSPNEM